MAPSVGVAMLRQLTGDGGDGVALEVQPVQAVGKLRQSAGQLVEGQDKVGQQSCIAERRGEGAWGLMDRGRVVVDSLIDCYYAACSSSASKHLTVAAAVRLPPVTEKQTRSERTCKAAQAPRLAVVQVDVPAVKHAQARVVRDLVGYGAGQAGAGDVELLKGRVLWADGSGGAEGQHHVFKTATLSASTPWTSRSSPTSQRTAKTQPGSSPDTGESEKSRIDSPGLPLTSAHEIGPLRSVLRKKIRSRSLSGASTCAALATVSPPNVAISSSSVRSDSNWAIAAGKAGQESPAPPSISFCRRPSGVHMKGPTWQRSVETLVLDSAAAGRLRGRGRGGGLQAGAA